MFSEIAKGIQFGFGFVLGMVLFMLVIVLVLVAAQAFLKYISDRMDF